MSFSFREAISLVPVVAATPAARVRIMALDRFFQFHSHPVNVALHRISVPLLFTTVAMLLPLWVPISLAVAQSAAYLLLLRRPGWALIPWLYVWIGHGVLAQRIPSSLTSVVWVAHGCGWMLQAIGHRFFEKAKPPFPFNLLDMYIWSAAAIWFVPEKKRSTETH